MLISLKSVMSGGGKRMLCLAASVAPRTSSSTLPRMVRAYCSPPPYPALLPDISYNELHGKLDAQEVTLIDVRQPTELDELGAVPGAINLPLQQLGLLILLPKEDFEVRMGVTKPSSSAPLVVMCMRGVRARTAQLALQGAGYNNVRRYLGSFTDWKENGGPVIKPSADDLA